MIVLILAALVVLLVAANVVLWKYGYVHSAEKPVSVMDRPVTDPKEKKAVMKRLNRWRDEGRLTREEFEHVYALCLSEWDPESPEGSGPDTAV